MRPPSEQMLDDELLTDLYQRHAHTLLLFIRRYASTREDAEDILLEVFVAASEEAGLATLSEGERLAWLRRVAHHFTKLSAQVGHRLHLSLTFQDSPYTKLTVILLLNPKESIACHCRILLYYQAKLPLSAIPPCISLLSGTPISLMCRGQTM